ncbi:hypothetical protein SAMN05216466_106139 [Paraburkholderia phenazinium]|uniref:Uncharacterized protein n=1 Tax=Paraburkholderia phenazinium TaxID=60549 RepID=A0A1G7YCZ1_9BURK|nr:HAD domain-containing protein [Paraburkholderia phenazinium]SDG94422.1 hypothetical protein SAMN05216466_106139 [Paraburkholderia phenazinium]
MSLPTFPEPLTSDDIRGHLRTRPTLAPGTWRTAWPGGLVRPDRGNALLLLDVDGVLHPDACDPLDHFCRLHLVIDVLDEVQDVDVVWASTWRFQKPWATLMARIPERLHERFIGATPAHLYPRGEACPVGPRRLEVEAFLADVLRDPSRPWVAVEDQPLYDGASHGQVLFCNPRTGLAPAGEGNGFADAGALRERLKRLSREGR